MKMQNASKRQQGFTLIEIIAVLVILGVLAAVAVPKYVDMQTQAKEKAILGACAAVSSNINLQFSKALLGGNSTSEALTYATSTGFETNLGDFTATAPSTVSGDSFSVTVKNNDDDGWTTDCDIANPAAN